MKKRIAFALIMGIITTGIISFVLVTLNTRYSGDKYVEIWLKSWGIAYLVVIPCILFLGPLVDSMVNKWFK